MDFRVKEADKSNIDSLVPLFESYREFYKQQPNPNWAKSFLLNLLKNKASMIFIACNEKNNNLIGFTQLYPLWSSVSMSKVWILNDLFVEQSSRKKGVARTLINTAINFAKKTGATKVQLSTEISNLRAKNLYESEGWIEDEEFDNYGFKL